MTEISIKCTLIDHKEIKAIFFCERCKIFMCKDCEKFHSKMFKNHCSYEINKDKSEIFTGLCEEENHNYDLKYFCRTHNKLCCAECIIKIKKKFGKHSDCDLCLVEDIENEKKNKLEENIKSLENLSINLQQSINELKIIYEAIDKNKEEIKKNIQKVFTNLRNCLNDREDELLLEIDKKFETEFFIDNIIKESEKLPNKVNISLEKGKLICLLITNFKE